MQPAQVPHWYQCTFVEQHREPQGPLWCIPGPLPWCHDKPGLLHILYVIDHHECLQWWWRKVPAVPSAVQFLRVPATMVESVWACRAISSPISHILPALDLHAAAEQQESLS